MPEILVFKSGGVPQEAVIFNADKVVFKDSFLRKRFQDHEFAVRVPEDMAESFEGNTRITLYTEKAGEKVLNPYFFEAFKNFYVPEHYRDSSTFEWRSTDS